MNWQEPLAAPTVRQPGSPAAALQHRLLPCCRPTGSVPGSRLQQRWIWRRCPPHAAAPPTCAAPAWRVAGAQQQGRASAASGAAAVVWCGLVSEHEYVVHAGAAMPARYLIQLTSLMSFHVNAPGSLVLGHHLACMLPAGFAAACWYCRTTCSHGDWSLGHKRVCKALGSAWLAMQQQATPAAQEASTDCIHEERWAAAWAAVA